jgi:hypothetical protein
MRKASGHPGLILRATHPDRVQVIHSGKAVVEEHGETSSMGFVTYYLPRELEVK